MQCIIDDFLPDPVAFDMRVAAIDAEYPPDGVTHDGATYPGMSLTMGKRFEEIIRPHLSAALGGAGIEYGPTFFRCMQADTSTAHGHDFRVHYDSAFGEYAFVLHLTEPGLEQGGTAFWKHTRLGITSVTPHTARHIDADLVDRDAWEIDSLVGARFNRGVIYPASKIHSAYPNTGWGDTPSNARLIWTALFSVEVTGDYYTLEDKIDQPAVNS